MVSDDKKFYFVGGEDASSLEELREVLAKIDDAEFVFHVNAAKNDFANWAEGVFQEKELAREMRDVFEKKRLIELLDNFFAKKNSGDFLQENERFDVREAKSWDEVNTDVHDEDSLPSFDSVTPTPPISYDRPRVKMPPLHAADEKSLSEDDLRNLVMESRKEISAGRQAEINEKQHRFVVKEFIYGFIIGLLFGLIMLGILFQLKPYC